MTSYPVDVARGRRFFAGDLQRAAVDFGKLQVSAAHFGQNCGGLWRGKPLYFKGIPLGKFVAGTRNTRSRRNGASVPGIGVSQESVVAGTRNTRFLRLVERAIPDWPPGHSQIATEIRGAFIRIGAGHSRVNRGNASGHYRGTKLHG
jgi:hypothetical protein